MTPLEFLEWAGAVAAALVVLSVPLAILVGLVRGDGREDVEEEETP
jgi:hypothetical protein